MGSRCGRTTNGVAISPKISDIPLLIGLSDAFKQVVDPVPGGAGCAARKFV